MPEKAKCFIVYTKFLDDSMRLIMGGLEKYIANLGKILVEAGHEVIVFQYARENFSVKFRGFTVVGVKNARSAGDILRWIDKNACVCGGGYEVDYSRDILIFATDFLIEQSKFKNIIAVQHGIAWDEAEAGSARILSNCTSALKYALRAIVKTHRYEHCRCLVCVDYNFINWYRTQVKAIPMNVQCIPNYAEVPPIKPEKDISNISIVFARRLVYYRGTRLFADASANILKKYPNISITVAGKGSDESHMREKLGGFPNVNFTSYSAEDSVNFHSKYNIAVLPTIIHEGTSLSLLEAMSAGCAVVSSNVGGLSNIIIDGYNGLMINPVQSELEEALERLITSPELRQKLSDNAYQTVKEGFSYEKWRKRWLKVIDEMTK